MKRCIIYLRASTNEEKQANSFNVQHQVLSSFCSTHGYNKEDVYAEYSSGKDNNRPEFNAAINRLREDKDLYLVAYRCDRLSRSMSAFGLINDVIPQLRFASLGNIEPNLMVLSVLFAAAANESIAIGARVKATVALLKKKGHTFGNPNIKTDAQPLGVKAATASANDFNIKINKTVAELKLAGYTRIEDIANRMNELNIKTRRGSNWNYNNLYKQMKSSA